MEMSKNLDINVGHSRCILKAIHPHMHERSAPVLPLFCRLVYFRVAFLSQKEDNHIIRVRLEKFFLSGKNKKLVVSNKCSPFEGSRKMV